MNGSWELNHVLDTLAKILIRCFIVGIIFMLVPFLFYVTNRSVVYSLHSQCRLARGCVFACKPCAARAE